MFDEDPKPDGKEFYAADAHLKCQYGTAGQYCPMAADCPTHHEWRMIEGHGKRKVSVGFCGEHYKLWYVERDARASDQVLFRNLNNPEAGKIWPMYERDLQRRMREDWLARYLAENPPRTKEERSSAMKAIFGQMQSALRP